MKFTKVIYQDKTILDNERASRMNDKIILGRKNDCNTSDKLNEFI